MMLKQRKLDPARRSIGGRVELEVCWRDDRFGKGPCFSVYDHGREILRFDLFDQAPHWHTYREATQPRHYFEHGVLDGRVYDRALLHRHAIGVARTKYAITPELERWLLVELWERTKHG